MYCELQQSPPQNYSQIAAQATAILDSGASGKFGASNVETYCTEVYDTTNPNSVQVANCQDMEAVKKVQLNLAPKLSPEAQSGHTYNDLKTGTLVSVGNSLMTTATPSSQKMQPMSSKMEKSS